MKVKMVLLVAGVNGNDDDVLTKIANFPEVPGFHDEINFANGIFLVFGGDDGEDCIPEWSVVEDEAALCRFCFFPDDEEEGFDREEAIRLAMEVGFVRS